MVSGAVIDLKADAELETVQVLIDRQRGLGQQNPSGFRSAGVADQNQRLEPVAEATQVLFLSFA